MTDFFVVTESHGIIREPAAKWHDIKSKPIKIGLKLGEKSVGEINVPKDAKGIIQCKWGSLVRGKIETTAHFIGYISKDGCKIVECFDYETGKMISGVNIDNLDLTPHTLYFI